MVSTDDEIDGESEVDLNSDDEISDDCVEFDKFAIRDVLADDTREGLPVPNPPTGYELEPAPSAMLKMSNLKGKKVLWALLVCRDGNLAGLSVKCMVGHLIPLLRPKGLLCNCDVQHGMTKTRHRIYSKIVQWQPFN